MTLSLPIPASRRGPSQVSLQQCLDYFVREEILEKDDAWYDTSVFEQGSTR
jgi:ubiquitin carboxyl-terminal hydrolase 8